jgi:cytoskeleton protein RodZ
MTDETVEQSMEQPVVPEAPAALKLSAGQMIKDARLASGLHIGSLSNTLKVPVKKLEALEAEDWTVLPDIVFVRALATSVCRQIKLDSAQVLAALPQAGVLKVDAQAERAPLNQPFRSPGDAKFTLANFGISMPMVIGAFVLLLAALILIFLPSTPKEAEQSKAQPQSAPVKPDPIMPPFGAADSSSTNSASTNTMPAPSGLTSATAPATAITAPATSTSPASQASAPAASGSPILRIASKGVVWIEVKDSKGVVLVQRTLQPKEVANVSGVPPLAVVIGRINEIESISVRGKPLSTVGMSPDNVARFEVK